MKLTKSWILLDTSSTDSVSNNPEFVQNIWDCSESKNLTVLKNGGDQTFSKFANLRMFLLRVHYDEGSLVTILLMKDIGNLRGVVSIMNSSKET